MGAQAKAQTGPDFERTLAKGSLCCVFQDSVEAMSWFSNALFLDSILG